MEELGDVDEVAMQGSIRGDQRWYTMIQKKEVFVEQVAADLPIRKSVFNISVPSQRLERGVVQTIVYEEAR